MATAMATLILTTDLPDGYSWVDTMEYDYDLRLFPEGDEEPRLYETIAYGPPPNRIRRALWKSKADATQAHARALQLLTKELGEDRG